MRKSDKYYCGFYHVGFCLPFAIYGVDGAQVCILCIICNDFGLHHIPYVIQFGRINEFEIQGFAFHVDGNFVT
jgi:hypothetical protein